MGLWNWSTTAANNATADPSINWQEGQAPSTVNDSARAMMAAIAAWYQAPEWLNYGDTPTYVDGTHFTVPGNLTGRYSVGRRVKVTVTAGTVYGSITASVYTSLTTVTVAWDSGSLDSGLSEVDVGMINPALPSLGLLPNLTISGNTFQVGTGQNSEIDLKISNANTTGWFFLNTSGANGFWDGTRSFSRWYSDTSGNFTVAGDLTSNSDERLKCDWAPMPSDFLESLAGLLRGTFTRTDTGKRQLGVGAQSLRRFMPEAVKEDADGILSVAYAQAALVACSELAAEVIRLRSILEPIK